MQAERQIVLCVDRRRPMGQTVFIATIAQNTTAWHRDRLQLFILPLLLFCVCLLNFRPSVGSLWAWFFKRALNVHRLLKRQIRKPIECRKPIVHVSILCTIACAVCAMEWKAGLGAREMFIVFHIDFWCVSTSTLDEKRKDVGVECRHDMRRSL